VQKFPLKRGKHTNQRPYNHNTIMRNARIRKLTINSRLSVLLFNMCMHFIVKRKYIYMTT